MNYLVKVKCLQPEYRSDIGYYNFLDVYEWEEYLLDNGDIDLREDQIRSLIITNINENLYTHDVGYLCITPYFIKDYNLDKYRPDDVKTTDKNGKLIGDHPKVFRVQIQDFLSDAEKFFKGIGIEVGNNEIDVGKYMYLRTYIGDDESMFLYEIEVEKKKDASEKSKLQDIVEVTWSIYSRMVADSKAWAEDYLR